MTSTPEASDTCRLVSSILHTLTLPMEVVWQNKPGTNNPITARFTPFGDVSCHPPREFSAISRALGNKHRAYRATLKHLSRDVRSRSEDPRLTGTSSDRPAARLKRRRLTRTNAQGSQQPTAPTLPRPKPNVCPEFSARFVELLPTRTHIRSPLRPHHGGR